MLTAAALGKHNFQCVLVIQDQEVDFSPGRSWCVLVVVSPVCSHSSNHMLYFCLQHHEISSSHVATAMSKDEHAILTARAAASPLFVLPIHKPPKGFCTLFIQWQPQQALITTLDEYKQLGGNAPPHFTMTLYRECASTHNLVLVRGDVLNPKLVSPAEVRKLPLR